MRSEYPRPVPVRKLSLAGLVVLLAFYSIPTLGDELSDRSLLKAACKQDTLPLFTNLCDKAFQTSTDKKSDASRYMLILLNEHTMQKYDPQFEALKCLHSQGADIEYENETFDAPTPLQAAVDRGNVQFMQWLIDEGADPNHITKKYKMTALEYAALWGREDLTRWLFDHGARVQEKKTKRPLLVRALDAESLYRVNTHDLIPFLVEKGADPYLKGDEQKAAVDILAERHSISLLRQLDTKGVYRKLVKEYTPAANSPFIGVWSNEKGGFDARGLILNGEGEAIIGTSVFPMGFFPWKTTDNNHAVIEANVNGKRTDIIVEWLAASNVLQTSIQGKAQDDLLKKQPRIPPKAEDIRKGVNSK